MPHGSLFGSSSSPCGRCRNQLSSPRSSIGGGELQHYVRARADGGLLSRQKHQH